jgi:cyclin D7
MENHMMRECVMQMEEVMSHSFRASAIRDMELALLKALEWRLACITPCSYLDLLPLPTTASNCTSLLLRSLSGNSNTRTLCSKKLK